MRVSAIITTFNRSRLLREAIKSVLAQEFKDFELIILDNSSSDDTESVVRSFQDPRIVYVKHQPVGISQARNLGIEKARGEFVGFVDDDDEWLPNKLREQIALFDKSSPRVGLVYGGFFRIRPTGEVYETFVPRLRGDVLYGYLCEHDTLTGSASNPLMRRSAVHKVGGYSTKVKTSEDWEFYLRLAREYEFDFVSEPILKIRQHSGPRLGDRLKDAAETELIAMEEFKDVLEKHRLCKSYYLQTVGGKYVRVGEVYEGRRYLAKALMAWPLNFTAWGQYLLSFLGSGFYRKAHAWYKKFR